MHTNFKQINHLFFSLFVCGSVNDHRNGLTFSLSTTKSWKFIIEIPYNNKCHRTVEENFNHILPIISILSPKNIEEITDDNYPLFIGDEEKLTATILKAYEDRTIDRLLIRNIDDEEEPVDFDQLTDDNLCRQYINNCIENYAPELPKNKIFKLSFTKFLYRRIHFFKGPHYRFNTTIKFLGSTAMKQIINEAKDLTQINFSIGDYPRIYLVYDPGFSLHVLHNGWNKVPGEIRSLFREGDPSSIPIVLMGRLLFLEKATHQDDRNT